jgi:hypothetical protein
MHESNGSTRANLRKTAPQGLIGLHFTNSPGTGDDRLVRKLLWEISRLREVVHQSHLYTNLLTSYIDDINAQAVHGKFEHLFESEPVVLERQTKTHYELPSARRWTHMSAEQEAELAAKMDTEQGMREAKRKSRESR